jgi:RNA binding exosome subunit
MQGTFHWLRVTVFCYATENEELIRETLSELVGEDRIECDTAESEHGNRILIFRCEVLKQKEAVQLFRGFGKDLRDELIECLEERVDDDCVLYLRLDKQEFVQGRYEIAHHGDVVSVTGKLVSHPARKEIAVAKMEEFLNSLDPLEG